MNDNDSAPRFDVRHRRDIPVDYGKRMTGWVMCCDGKDITIPFFSQEEARDAMRRIEIIYERYGW